MAIVANPGAAIAVVVINISHWLLAGSTGAKAAAQVNLDWKRPPSDKPEPAFTVKTRMHSTRASPTRRAKRCAPDGGLPRSLGGPLAAKHARAVRSGAKKWAAVGEGIGAAGALLARRGWPQN